MVAGRGRSPARLPLQRDMNTSNQTIEQAQAFIGDDLKLDRLDQIFDLQRLLGPVIAYKVALGVAVNSKDPKVQLSAARTLLDATGEDPSTIAERLRASLFKDLTLQQLEAVVQTGITDPEEAVKKLRLVG